MVQGRFNAGHILGKFLVAPIPQILEYRLAEFNNLFLEEEKFLAVDADAQRGNVAPERFGLVDGV